MGKSGGCSALYRFRSGCDLKLAALARIENNSSAELSPTELQRDIASAIQNAGFSEPRVTKIYWPSDELFKSGKDDDKAQDGAGEESESEETSD